MDLTYFTFNENDVDAIKAALGAGLDTYRGRSSTASVIDTLQLTRSATCADLAVEDLFQEYVEGYDVASADLVFHHDQVGDVRVQISIVNGSIWIRTAVPEEVIDFVFHVVQEVKAQQ